MGASAIDVSRSGCADRNDSARPSEASERTAGNDSARPSEASEWTAGTWECLRDEPAAPRVNGKESRNLGGLWGICKKDGETLA
jgi:hypothetical protein